MIDQGCLDQRCWQKTTTKTSHLLVAKAHKGSEAAKILLLGEVRDW